MPETGTLEAHRAEGPNLAHTETMLDAYLERFIVQGGGEGLHPTATPLEEFLDLYKEGYLERLADQGLSREQAIERRGAKMGMAPVPSAAR